MKYPLKELYKIRDEIENQPFYKINKRIRDAYEEALLQPNPPTEESGIPVFIEISDGKVNIHLNGAIFTELEAFLKTYSFADAVNYNEQKLPKNV